MTADAASCALDLPRTRLSGPSGREGWRCLRSARRPRAAAGASGVAAAIVLTVHEPPGWRRRWSIVESMLVCAGSERQACGMSTCTVVPCRCECMCLQAIPLYGISLQVDWVGGAYLNSEPERLLAAAAGTGCQHSRAGGGAARNILTRVSAACAHRYPWPRCRPWRSSGGGRGAAGERALSPREHFARALLCSCDRALTRALCAQGAAEPKRRRQRPCRGAGGIVPPLAAATRRCGRRGDSGGSVGGGGTARHELITTFHSSSARSSSCGYLCLLYYNTWRR